MMKDVPWEVCQETRNSNFSGNLSPMQWESWTFPGNNPDKVQQHIHFTIRECKSLDVFRKLRFWSPNCRIKYLAECRYVVASHNYIRIFNRSLTSNQNFDGRLGRERRKREMMGQMNAEGREINHREIERYVYIYICWRVIFGTTFLPFQEPGTVPHF